MNWVCCLYLLACSITLLKAQGTADGCVTCAVGDFLKSSWENWILPAASTLQFLVPDSTLAPDTPIPETDRENQGINDLPGRVNQPDIKLQNIVSGDKECNPNGAGVSNLRGADQFTIPSTMIIFFSVIVNVMRRGNSSNNLAFTGLLRRRGSSQLDFE